MLDCDPQTDRCAIVEDVEGEAFQPDHFSEAIDRSGEIFEVVLERFARWERGLPEARQVRRDQMKSLGEHWNQIAEHMSGGGKSMQEQQGRSVDAAGLAIRDLEAIEVSGAIVNRLHDEVPRENVCGDQTPPDAGLMLGRRGSLHETETADLRQGRR